MYTSIQLVRQRLQGRREAQARQSLRRARSHQDISRKATTLLQSYENRLGVRVEDIRSRPQLAERDLDLLLQVQAFAKAAIWYEQAFKAGNSGEGAFDNFGRILLRSARRVDQGMETATQDQRFGDAWSSIQANLRQIRLDESTSSR